MKKKVVILGAGFGGLYAAKALGNKREVDVLVIDKRNFHLFQPLLYQVATGGLSPGDIASPIRAVLNRFKNVQVLQGTVTSVDFSSRRLHVLPPESGEEHILFYDYLILATGMQNNYFSHFEWEEKAPGLKTIEDALEIRKRIFLTYEKAEWSIAAEEQKSLMTFLVVGGGATGVELCGALAELARYTLRKDFRNIDTAETRILLVEAGERILPSFHEDLSRKAEKILRRKGVEVLTNTRVIDIKKGEVLLQREGETQRVNAGVVLWAAGVKAARIWANYDEIPCDFSGRIIVENDLSIPHFPEVMVIGDLASCSSRKGEPLPGTAPVAMQQGKYAAKRILRMIRGKAVVPFRYHHRGSLAVIGRNAAIAEFGRLRFSGFFAWLLWVFIHIAYLIEFDNKFLVLFQWAVDYFTRKKGARLITHEERESLPRGK